MRTIDADYLMERLNRKKSSTANKRYTEGFNDCLMRVRSMVHSMPTLPQPSNEALTLEELRGMDGVNALAGFIRYIDKMRCRPPEGEEDT
nr:MAG TPA: hypothetical protein [Caudoviricetes sp.]